MMIIDLPAKLIVWSRVDDFHGRHAHGQHELGPQTSLDNPLRGVVTAAGELCERFGLAWGLSKEPHTRTLID